MNYLKLNKYTRNSIDNDNEEMLDEIFVQWKAKRLRRNFLLHQSQTKKRFDWDLNSLTNTYTT